MGIATAMLQSVGSASQLDAAIAGSWRMAVSRTRDIYRHSEAALQFFGVRPSQTVIEIIPGGGWYTEILAPLLCDHGHYIAAVEAPAGGEAKHHDEALRRKFAADSVEYRKACIVGFDPKAPVFGPLGSADRVLTFRNVHNWAEAGTAQAMFKAFLTVLRLGGVLGDTDHRATPGATLAEVESSDYLSMGYVIKLATDTGFKPVGQSKINANPKDTKEYSKGVRTLPSTLTLGSKGRAQYLAIDESDRMTLRFVKPAEAVVH
jgi:predicted methyltransferase